MNALFDLPAPAKLNLFLHVLGRQANGYHQLQSVFMLVDWQDTLHLETRPNGQISRQDLSTPLPADDLCTRAATLLQKATGCALGVHISLHKSVPAQAGMGGGSSDAATCLIGLNRLWGLNLSRTQLAQIGLQLGADVPFFVSGHNAWVEGIGELISPITLANAQFLVIKPPQGLNTQEIFTAQDLQRDTKPATILGFLGDAFAPYSFGQNDLQAVATRLCPEIGVVLQFLDSVGLKGRMTGSGSAVFAHLPDNFGLQVNGDQASRLEVLKDLLIAQQHEHQWVFRFCKSLGQHPLLEWCN